MVSGLVSKTLISIGLLIASSSASATPSYSLSTQPVLTQDYVHVVKNDESLGLIAQEEYGNSEYWSTIWNDNQWMADPSILFSGWKLKIRAQKPLLVEKPREMASEAVLEPQNSPIERANVPASTAPVAIASYPQSNYDDIYKAAGARYGVPWQILYGLHLTETGLRNGPIMNHSGSGAEGPLQFMPGTWGAYGVDGDGDGRADIDNAVDAIYGAANYVAKHGSVTNALRYYGGNTPGVLAAARSRGYTE
jgi:soluble lytic murein transglycosylase-like protein